MMYHYFEIGKKMREVESTKPLTLAELHTLVGEPIAFVYLKNDTVACINGNGNIDNLPYNPCIKTKDTISDIDEGIRGNVLIGKVRKDGEFIGIA